MAHLVHLVHLVHLLSLMNELKYPLGIIFQQLLNDEAVFQHVKYTRKYNVILYC